MIKKHEEVKLVRKVEHVGIVVKNMKQMVKFYQDKLGMSLIGERNQTPGCILENFKVPKKVVFIDAGNTIIELLDYGPFTEERPKEGKREIIGITHIAFSVDDVYETVRDLKRKGVSIDVEPVEGDNDILAFIKDPEGNLLELYRKK